MLHYKRMTNEEREELDRKITGDTRTDLSREEMVHLVAVRVSERLKRLEREGRADFRIYRGSDRRQYCWLSTFSGEIYLRLIHGLVMSANWNRLCGGFC